VKYRSLATGAKFLSVLAVKAVVSEKRTGQKGILIDLGHSWALSW
jgi:hypothetical protein